MSLLFRADLGPQSPLQACSLRRVAAPLGLCLPVTEELHGEWLSRLVCILALPPTSFVTSDKVLNSANILESPRAVMAFSVKKT